MKTLKIINYDTHERITTLRTTKDDPEFALLRNYDAWQKRHNVKLRIIRMDMPYAPSRWLTRPTAFYVRFDEDDNEA